MTTDEVFEYVCNNCSPRLTLKEIREHISLAHEKSGTVIFFLVSDIPYKAMKFIYLIADDIWYALIDSMELLA